MTVERVRDVRQSAHAVNQVHRLLGRKERRHAARDEQADHLALERLDLFARDRQLGCYAHQAQRSFDRVVVGQRETVETALTCPLDQLLK